MMTPGYQYHGSRFLRVLWIGLLALTCVRVWLGGEYGSSTAAAQIPDSGLQRLHMLEELKEMNLLLKQIHQTLKNDTLKVRIEGADNTRTDNKRRR